MIQFSGGSSSITITPGNSYGAVALQGASPGTQQTGGFNVSAQGIALVQDRGGAVYNVKAYGAACDGLTDDSTAILSALTAAKNAGGGTLLFPAICRMDSQLLLPNDGALPQPNQVNIRLTGIAGGHAWYGTLAGGLDLRYSGVGGKIETLGKGTLVIDHMQLKDGGVANATPLLHTTNTTVLVNACTFSGSGSVTQDAIVLGGSTATIGGGTGDAFQGYGTVIDSNHFTRLNRGVYARTYANSIVVTNNSWQGNVGSRAIESDGSAGIAGGKPNEGLVISGNLFEMDVYTYGVVLTGTKHSLLSGNSFWDPGVAVLGGYYLTSSTSTQNTFILSGKALGTSLDVMGDANALATSTVVGADAARTSTYGSSPAANEAAYGLVVKGTYDSTKTYPGPLTVASMFTPARYLTIGYDDVGESGVVDSYKAGIGAEPLKLNPSGGVVWVPSLTFDGTSSLSGSANAVAVRNGLNAQTFTVYKSYTSGSNYKGLVINGQQIYTAYATGGNEQSFQFGSGGGVQWAVSYLTGSLLPNANGSYDVGASGLGLKRLYLDYTNTATVGAVTINKAAGRVNIAAAGTSVVVTNSLVTAASHVFAVVSQADATAYVKNVVPAAGSFTITLGAAATAQVSIDFFVVNAD